MRILAISGSLRRGSHNTRLLRAAAALLAPDARVEHWDGLRHIPPFDEDDEAAPPAAVEALRGAVAGADGVLISTPEYNAGIPGQLKNAIDWLSRPFPENALRGKPVAVIGASTGLFGAVWAQDQLRKSLAFAGARPLEDGLPVGQAHEALDHDGRPTDADALHTLTQLLAELVRAAHGHVVSS